jgi:hypothetical protein
MCELMVIIRSRPTYLDKVYPESDGPRLGRNDEGGNQRPHIRRQDNECCPDVDLASPLVKEEHVEDEHQSPTLRDSAEEPVQDTRSHEGFKCCRCCAPCRSGGSDGEKVEQNWQSPCPCRKCDDEDATCIS